MRVLICLLSLPVSEATVGRQRLERKLATLWFAAVVLWLPLGSAERVG